MDPLSLSRQVGGIAAGPGSRAERAERIAQAIRIAGGYRWVGLYDVLDEEISVVGWSGPSPPAYPRFPPTQGLCGTAAASGETIIANDVAREPRYLTTLGTTRAEMIVPVLPASAGAPPNQVIGLLDVESDRSGAFTEADQGLLEDCAACLAPLWKHAVE